MSAILRVQGLSKRFGGFVALDGIDLEVQSGERLGLIGPNGSGKSTLVNCICGTLQNETGSVQFDGHVVDGLAAHERTHRGLARSFQLPRPFPSLSLADNLRIPMLYTVHKRSGTPLHADNIEARCAELLQMVGLANKGSHRPRDLTQVEMRKLELARAMAARPRMLISDEAMAGLASNEVGEVLDILFRLNAAGITIIMIEHIMQAVMRFSQRVICLDAGKIICEGTPDSIVANPEVQRAYLGA
jgi:branched-chain amino acid transport system ATP-binding protein